MEQEAGEIIHYYDKIGVGVVRLSVTLHAGDRIKVKGKALEFEQAVSSMQVDRKPVEHGEAGGEVALKLDQPAHEGDRIYKLS